MDSWPNPEQLQARAWHDYRELLLQAPFTGFPSAAELQSLLPAGLVNTAGLTIFLRSAEDLPAANYEQRIYDTGQISTRPGSWHDLCNALVWTRLPLAKAAMNQLHVEAMAKSESPARGCQRDALTLFDECGALVISQSRSLLEALTARNWHTAFVELAGQWPQHTRIVVSGHAILEKSLQPYKSMTAQCLLIEASGDEDLRDGKAALAKADGFVAQQLIENDLLSSNQDLAPVPLAGIPGWWHEAQDQAFYADKDVFRLPRTGLQPAPVFTWSVSPPV